MHNKTLISALALSAGFAMTGGAALADPATPDRLLDAGSDAEAGNWMMVHRTYDSHRFSPLDEINASNVQDLELAFAVPLGGLEPTAFGTPNLESTPLAKDGFVYMSDPWGTPYKIAIEEDRADIVWTCDTGIDKDPSLGILQTNRGLGLWNDLVITVLSDGRVVACDDETGDVAWDQQIATEPGEGFTNAPLVVGDMIYVGQSYGDWATRGWIAALDAETGEEQWRFYTVPEPGEPGSETWLCEEAGNPGCWETGGAAAWVTGSYDPESNSLLWGTGNPVPMFDPEYRPGDNLYSNSALSLDADSGDLNWYFQYTPGDYMDYDEVGVNLLIDTEIDGETRKTLQHFGRNGFFYQLDRTNGSFINASQYVSELTWTPGIDPKTGKPVNYDPNASLQEYNTDQAVRREGGAVENCPQIQGGVNFFPTAYNPETNMAYGAGIEGCSSVESAPTDPEDVAAGAIFQGGGATDAGEINGSITAMDASTGEEAAKADREYPNYAGVMTTPDLVWTGELDGTFGAYDAETLEQLWSINVGTAFKAPPIAFEANGKQYIAIAGGAIADNTFGHEELEGTPGANMLYFFSL